MYKTHSNNLSSFSDLNSQICLIQIAAAKHTCSIIIRRHTSFSAKHFGKHIAETFFLAEQ